MSGGHPEELIRELARDLDPIRPIPRIRTVVAAVIGLWLAVAAIGLSLLGLRPDLVEATLGAWGVAAVFAGLGLAGLGGVVSALALGVPGREVLARAALGVALLGVIAAAAVGTVLVAITPVDRGAPVPFTADLGCLCVAMWVGLLPAVGVVWFGGRAAPFRPVVLVLAAAAGTAALGAIAAQASCPHSGMRHLMIGHALAPAVGALLLTLPLLVALRRFGRS